MAGLFSEWQPRYAECGIATFPVRIDGTQKKPAVSNWQRMGRRASTRLLLKFGEFDALGFQLGPRSRISVLDVDTRDERVFADALNRHGQTPIHVRSGRGHHQAWYRHAGEPRDCGTFRRRLGLPIDLLGDGLLVAPPSRGSYGPYQFIRGGLDDLGSLPIMKGLEGLLKPLQTPAGDHVGNLVPEGRRNNELWRACMREAARGGERGALTVFAQQFNSENCKPQLAAEEVTKIVASVWNYTQSGDNWFAVGNGMITISQDAVKELGASHPRALALLLLLRSWHFERDEFILSNNVHKKLGWTLPAFRSARSRLTRAGEIRCIHPGGSGRHDPPIYEWCQGVRNRSPI